LVAVEYTNGLRGDWDKGTGCLDVHECAPNKAKEHDDVAHADAVRDRRVIHVNHDEGLEEAGGDVNEEEEALDGSAFESRGRKPAWEQKKKEERGNRSVKMGRLRMRGQWPVDVLESLA